MGLADGVVLVVLGLNLFAGFRAGLVRQLAGLLGTVAGLAAAFYYYDETAVALEKYFHLGTYLRQAMSKGEAALPGAGDLLLHLIALLAVYAAVSLAIHAAGQMTAGLVRAVHLSFVDRCGGAGLGLIKGILVLSLAARLLTLLAWPGAEAVLGQSRYLPTLMVVTERVFREMESIVPGEFVPRRIEQAKERV